MTPAARHAAGVTIALVLAGHAAVDAAGCTLVLHRHRGGDELARLALAADAPQLRIAFSHSVLGTPVVDRYAWRDGRWRLVEEVFEGEGYGLPHAAGPGETLERHGRGWRLALDREVHPLVVRPLAAQRMRVVVDGQPELLLARLGGDAVELRASGCDAG